MMPDDHDRVIPRYNFAMIWLSGKAYFSGFVIDPFARKCCPMQKIFRLLLYLSLVFFLWYLYRTDYLVFRDIRFDPWLLAASILLLIAGFLVVCLSWGTALNISGKPVGFTDAVISQGTYVFAKYIPGKLWVILGRASWFSPDRSGLKFLSLVSLQEQLVFLWWGLALSLPPTFFILQKQWLGLIIAAGTALLTVLLFSSRLYRYFSRIISRIFKRNWEFRPMKWSFFFKVSLPVLLFWLLWSAGFWFLMISVFDDIPALHAFIFPAGMTYGFMVIFLPAGIGVREGILAAFLMAGGLTAENAITVSVISRFWFIAGEIFLFLLAWTLKLTGVGQPASVAEAN